MVEDRYYMRQSPFGMKRSATMILLVANAAAFLLQCVVLGYPSRAFYGGVFALSAEGIRHGFVWQLLTFQFMHAGLVHLFMNCWGLYMFGRDLEESLGRARFLTLYFASGVVGGLAQACLGILFPYSQFAGQVVGASAGVFGLVAAFAMLRPEEPIMFLFMYVIPVSIRAKFFLLFSVLLASLGILFPRENLANAAHLGGIAMGVLYVRFFLNWQWRLPRLKRTPKAMAYRPLRAKSDAAADWAEASADEDLRGGDFVSREVDPILDKISAHGIHSLTDRERRILESARARMAKH